VQPHAAICRPLQPDDDFQERALAGPVGTDDGDDVAVVDLERYVVDGREPPETLRYGVDLEKQAIASDPTTGDGTGSAAST
jgi:hypothetical protein